MRESERHKYSNQSKELRNLCEETTFIYLFSFCGALYRTLQSIAMDLKWYVFLISGHRARPKEKRCRSFLWLVSMGPAYSFTGAGIDSRYVLHPGRQNKLDGRK